VTKVVSSAADANGDFLVPLSKDNIENLKETVCENLEDCDEAFLTTLNSWMTKTREEVEKMEEMRKTMKENGATPENEIDTSMSGMVEVLAKVFQTYAGQALKGAKLDGSQETKARPLLLELLDTDAEEWNNLIFQKLKAEPICSPDDLVNEIAAMIEGVVLGQVEGSMTQRVQAEYLRELLNRVSPYQQENQGGL
jgi:alanyl-tRNA synthetase